MKLREVSLFSGIGGFSLAAERLGIQTIQHVEIDRNAQLVLKDNFPNVPIHDDIRSFRPVHRGANLFTVGFPCYSTSNAGDRTGLLGAESGLWFEALRCIVEGEPAFVVIENPTGLIDRGLRAVLGGLRMAGYRWESPTILSAAMLGAPHRRERVFIIAYADRLRWAKQPPCWAEQVRYLAQAKQSHPAWPQFQRGVDGAVARLPSFLDTVPVKVQLCVAKGTEGRLKSRVLFGRSVVPAVAEIPLQRVLTLAECVGSLTDF
jgi:DNA (cytosine-5)-methyltransferase 1